MLVVYHPSYVFGSRFLDNMHPFEFDRPRRAVEMLREELGTDLDALLREPSGPATFEQLAAVHDSAYLEKATHSGVVASILEVPKLAWCPRFLMRRWFVTPSLWGVAGTLLAAREAAKEGLVFNLGGGFHHAKRSGGEGFCLFSDIALAIHTLRADGTLLADDSIFYVDLDVHQGNGVSCDFAGDPSVRILDVFNGEIYPFRDKEARAGIDVSRPLPSSTRDQEYLETLDHGLEELFKDRPLPKLVIYNAGSDVFHEDMLGDFKLTREGVTRRDLTVVEAVRGRGIPMIVLASGGYSRMSARLIADFILGAYRYERTRVQA